MRMDRYHDTEGNRVKLDTRHLQWCADNAPARRARELENKGSSLSEVAAWAVRGIFCLFCGVFAVRHIDVIFRSGGMILELIGVVAALAYIAVTIERAWEEADR